MNKKIITIIFILLIGCGIFYFYNKIVLPYGIVNDKSMGLTNNNDVEEKTQITKTESDNEIIEDGWKLYKNTEIGLSFVYPDDWIPESKNGLNHEIRKYIDLIYRKSTTQAYPDKNKPMDAFINVITISNPRNLTLQKIFNNQHDECEKNVRDELGCPPVENVSEWKKYKINGYTAYETGYKPSVGEGGGLSQNLIYIDKSDYFILVEARNFNLRNTYDPAPIFEKIIPSIKIF